MTNFKKATFKSIVDDGKGGKKVQVNNGYEFTAYAIDGKTLNMCVAEQEHGIWRVIDPRIGRAVSKGFTRKEAVEKATSPDTVMYYTNLYRSDQYAEHLKRFAELTGEDYTIAAEDGTVIAEVEHHDLTEKPKAPAKAPAKPKVPKKPTAKKTTAKKPAAKKPTPKKDGELAKALKEIEALKKELADLKAEKVEEVVSEWTIESVRKWAVPRGFVADQVNPERKDCIWVYGVRKDDKATQKELMSMGFRWGKKGWYVDPKRG